MKTQLAETLKETEQLVWSYNLKDSIQYLLWNDLLNKHTLKGANYDTYQVSSPTNSNPVRYASGRKVLVDFGYGIDRELFQPHPAIVLGDFKELLVVVPTNSDDGSSFPGDLEKALIRIPTDSHPSKKYPIFPKDTIINLHQIRHISKNRVKKDLKANVKLYNMPNSNITQLNGYLPYPVLNHGDSLHRAIMVQLARIYSPDVLFEIKRLQDHITTLEAQVAMLTSQLATMTQAAAGLTTE